jgi:hypothetical protein
MAGFFVDAVAGRSGVGAVSLIDGTVKRVAMIDRFCRSS